MIEVLDPGPFATVQDLGRPGYAALGVPLSGAFDRGALRTANRLVGNDEGAAAIEALFGGLRLRALDAVTVAVTGAPCAVRADPVAGGWGVALSLPAGAVLELGTPRFGSRCYVAVGGGLDVDRELGSASTDTMGGIGPPPLRRGDRPAIGTPRGLPSAATAIATPARPLVVRLGPRDDWFSDPSALLETEWTVRDESDRVGVRLDGPPLARARRDELPSEPTRPGAVQVPGDGRPIVFGPDAPTTGGYPVIAVVTDLDAAAQLRPGDRVRFTTR